jgi:hypothetical protein
MEQTLTRRESSSVPGWSHDEAEVHRVLETLSQVAARQREAILAGDVRTLNRLFDALLQLHAELGALMAELPVGDVPEWGGKWAAIARRVREQFMTNRVLLGNGIAITDHFMATAVDSASAAALFTGVA